ncbi:MAG TPA: aldehyde dehydrogenase (NADP(+)) [Opitutaceae bacterium]|jgi:NADP-dependent aldehyde dehydrogenase
MQLTGQSLIAGRPTAAGKKSFAAVNPATKEALAPAFVVATAEEVDQAVKAAADAAPVLQAASPEKRAQLLETIAAEIELVGPTLLERANAESGLPLARLSGERDRTCSQLRLFASVVREGSWIDARIDPALPDRKPLPRPDLRRMLAPLGPVAVFGASNFPLAFSVAGGDTASAFAAGCPVIAKAHEAHPCTSELVGSAIVRALAACDLPIGLFSLLQGPGAEVGVPLVKHPLLAAVGFTGSHTAGRALCDLAALRPNPIPVFAEMSSVNPVFLLPGAVRERGSVIAQGLLGSVTLGVGQFCTKPGLIFVLRDNATKGLMDAVAAGVPACAPGTMLTPGIRERFLQVQERLRSLPGIRVAAAREPGSAAKNEAAVTVAATTAADFLRTPEMATEAFGPFTLFVEASSMNELLACAHAIEGQLTATLHGNDSDWESAGPLLDALERKAGRLLVNGFPTGVEVSHAMHHGGPSPATSDPRFTSVGTAAILRWARPVCYQNFPAALLPAALRDDNPLQIWRRINGALTREPLASCP